MANVNLKPELDGSCQYKTFKGLVGTENGCGARGQRGFLRKIVWIFFSAVDTALCPSPHKMCKEIRFPYCISLYVLLGKMHPSIEYSLKVSLQRKQWLPTGYLPLGVKHNADPCVVLILCFNTLWYLFVFNEFFYHQFWLKYSYSDSTHTFILTF